ncbi:MAG TPA: hypothetical protein VF939_27390 [Puia sp.]
MKKLVVLSMVAFLFSGVTFAHDNGKEKGKKAKPTCTKSCPGKECCKKKGS